MRLRPITLALGLAVAVAACASSTPGGPASTPGPGATSSLVPAEEGSPEPSESGDASAEPSEAITSPVRGLVLHVDLAGLGKVTGFRLLMPDGTQLDFKMGVQENAAEFPAAHLSEHMAGAQPILVYFRPSGSDLVVYRLEDAPPASGSPQAIPSSGAGSPTDTPIGSPFPADHSDVPAAS